MLRNWRYPVKVVHRGPAFGVKDALHPNGHRGTDYNGFPAGEPLFAVCDGMTVVLNKGVKDSAVLGNVIVLQVGTRFFGYCHLKVKSPLAIGQVVNHGDIVGHAGNTGSASAGVHLHLTLSDSAEGVFSGNVEDADAFLTAKIAEEKKAKK